MGMKPGPRQVRNIKELERLKPSDGIVYINRHNGSVICSVNDPYHNWFVNVPQYAFDAVSKGGAATVEEIRNYIRDHPQP